MAPPDRPTFHVIAGPNGSGKSTLYESSLKARFPEAEFVNADLMAKAHFGHHASTAAESRMGQDLAETRRQELLRDRKSLCMESTFSHPSKNALVEEAMAAGYRINLYHVNVRNADLAVRRVGARVTDGGHPVPEEKIRQRYERNQALIHEAAKVADHAYVFDNSALNKPHALAIELYRGSAVRVGRNVPTWARNLYADELERYSPQKLNPAAASFQGAAEIAQKVMGPTATTYVARPNGRYKGQVIGQSELHTIQQISSKSAIAHFTFALNRTIKVGDQAQIHYDAKGSSRAEIIRQGPHAAAATAWQRDPVKAARNHPVQAPEMAKANAILEISRATLLKGKMNARDQQAVLKPLAGRLAQDIEHGRAVPELRIARSAEPATTSKDQDIDR